jgi:peroxiredoxin
MYISLFNRVEGLPNQRQRYAESIINTLQHLQEPYYAGFLAGSIMETERFGWLEERDTILAQVVKENINFKTNIPSLQFSLNSFLMRHKGIAPKIAGLSDQKNPEKTVLAFHDSDCNSCLNEMQTLARRYEHLRKNKIRVVSIAADKNQEHFEAEVRNFPWADKLCDFQGFEGVNFTAFGVMATPTFFVISKEGKIEGEFYDANELINNLLGE